MTRPRAGLSDFLHQHGAAVIEAWEREVQQLPEARSPSASALRDQMPELLTAIAEGVEGAPRSTVPRRAQLPMAHSSVATELLTLRRIVLEKWRESNGPSIDVGEVLRFDATLDEAVTVSVSRYAEGLDRATSLVAQEAVRERELRTAAFREEFVGIVGHDLRNPLSAIRASAEFMSRQLGDGHPLQGAAKRILGSCDRMTRMITELLDFTRTRLGSRMPVERGPADLGKIAEDVVEEFRIAHPERQLELGCEGDLGGDWDADRLMQALGNLVGNALTHGEPGSAVVVKLRGEAAVVAVSVWNAGAIPAQHRPDLFQPFKSAGGGRGRREGLGLGLYIVREIASAHGGSVEARSTLEDGTLLTLTVPRRVGL